LALLSLSQTPGFCQESSKEAIDKLHARLTAPPQPAKSIPSNAESLQSVEKVYLYGGHMFHLADRKFFLLLFDTPNALVLTCKASFRGSDATFHYFHEPRFNEYWAFSIAPAGSFAAHSVWSRRADNPDWLLRSCEAIMARSSVAQVSRDK